MKTLCILLLTAAVLIVVTEAKANKALTAIGSLIRKQARKHCVRSNLPDHEIQLNSSCAAIHTYYPKAASGVYMIYPAARAPGRSVYCDMKTDGGGWTRIQRREDGSVSFNQNWAVYKRGFGSPQGEFWLGNNDLHRLTSAQPSQLRIDLWDFAGAQRYAKYSSFRVSDESSYYKLTIGGYSGNAGDSLKWHKFEYETIIPSPNFSTKDQDNDMWHIGNCATSHGGGGGWWYMACGGSNLNGRYVPWAVYDRQGIHWYSWRLDYSYNAAQMMVRPADSSACSTTRGRCHTSNP